MNTKFIGLILCALFLAPSSHAGNTVNINFDVWSDNENITLPDAYKGTIGYTFSVSSAADYSIISEDTIRFKLHNPAEMKVIENGSEYSILIASVDYKTTSADIEALKLLTSDEKKSFLYSRVMNDYMPHSRLIEASTEKGSLMPYLKEGIIPSLMLFRGNISLNTIKLEVLKEKGNRLEGSIIGSFNDVVKIDSGRILYDGTSSSGIDIDYLVKGILKSHDARNPETLAIIDGINRLRDLKEGMFGGFFSFTDENGRKMIGIKEPKKGNVTEFPGKGCKKIF